MASGKRSGNTAPEAHGGLPQPLHDAERIQIASRQLQELAAVEARLNGAHLCGDLT